MKRIKSTFSIILALVMVLSILPLGLIPASAASTGPELLTVAGKTYRLGVDTLPAGLSFDSEDTLTLNNYTGGAISLEAGGANPSHYQAFIKLIGKNEISTSTGNEIYMKNSNAALYSQGELSISGDNNASLSINFDSRVSGVDLYGIYVDKQYIGGTGEEDPKKNFTVSDACSVNVFLSSDVEGEEMCGVYAGNIRVYSNSALDIEVEDLQKSRRYVYAAYSRGYFDINTNKWVRLDVFGDESSQALCETSNVSPVISSSSSIYLKSYDAPNFNGTSHGVRFPSGVTESNFVKSVFEGNYTSYVSKTSTLLKPITADDVESAFNYPVINSKFNSSLKSDKFYGSVQWCYKMSSTPLLEDTIAADGESYNAKMSLVPKAGYKLDSSALSQAQLHSVFKNRDGNMQYYYNSSSSSGGYSYGFIGGTFKAEKIKVDRIVIKDAGVPVSGQTLPSTFTVDSNAPYEYYYAKWYNETENKWADGEEAKKGNTYVFYPYVKIKDKTAYTFDALSNITASVNGNEYTEIFSGSAESADEIVCVKSMRYTANKTLIKDITIDIAYDPVAGEFAVPALILPDDAPYEVDTAEDNGWYNQTDFEVLAEDDVFEAGKTYSYMLNLKIKDSTQYVFDSNSNLSIEINGIAPSTKNSTGESLYIMSMPFHVHEYTDWKNDSVNHWKECSCGEKAETANHTSSDWIIDKAATTSEEGLKHKECTVCKYVLESETIDKLAPAHFHSYSSDWKSDNSNHWKECSCGEKAETANHTSSDWIIDKAATTSEEGLKHKECTVCKYVIATEKIAKIAENPVVKPTEPTTAKPAETTTVKSAETTTAKPAEITTAKSAETTTAKSAETTTAKSAEATTAKSAETTTAKSAETTTAKSAEATTAKSAEATTAKSAETTTAKPAETTTAKSAETTTAKSAETTTAKSAETTTAKQPETTTAKQPENNTAKPAETTTAKADEKLEFADKADVNGKIDEENKKVSILPKETKGITLDDFKAMFKSAISVAEEKIEKVYNGMKFMFNGNEYTFILKGDVSADGKISASDARTILRIAAKLEQPDEVTKESADINSDDKVTSKEARSVLRFAAKLQKEIYE